MDKLSHSLEMKLLPSVPWLFFWGLKYCTVPYAEKVYEQVIQLENLREWLSATW